MLLDAWDIHNPPLETLSPIHECYGALHHDANDEERATAPRPKTTPVSQPYPNACLSEERALTIHVATGSDELVKRAAVLQEERQFSTPPQSTKRRKVTTEVPRYKKGVNATSAIDVNGTPDADKDLCFRMCDGPVERSTGADPHEAFHGERDGPRESEARK